MHYIYVLHDKEKNMYYVGKHKCKNYENPYNDGYMGSGIIVNNIRNKIGYKEFNKRFEKYVVEFLPGDFSATDNPDDVNSAERSWIAYYKELFGVDKLYNRSDGGDGGNTWEMIPEDRKRELRISARDRFKGVPRSEEAKRKSSEKLKGRKFSKSHIKHLSESLKASGKNKGVNNPFYGKSHTKEVKDKCSELNKELMKDPKRLKRSRMNGAIGSKKISKGVVCTNKITLESVEFGSISSAARWFCDEVDTTRKVRNVISSIVNCASGKCDSAYGYIWEYTEDNMKRMNAYSMDIYQYNMEHGTDIFMEYKMESTTSERRKEIEDWLFNLMRTKGVVPITILDEHSEQADMISLSERKPEDSYDFINGDYKTNSIGVTFLNKFFARELCDIRKPSAPKTIEEAFNDDETLKKVIRKALKYTEDEMGVFRWILLAGSAGYCVNFRPATVKALLEIWGPKENCRYLDTSAGYGARCLGAHFATNCIEYLGIDPNTAESCANEIEFLDSYYPTNTKKQVLKMGSEDFTPENFPQYQNYFDISFTSPPYFNTEQYSSDETQSYKKFPTYAGWCSGFLQATIDNTCSALKIDGIFAMNIFEKVPNIKSIIKLFLANNGFYVFQSDKYLLKTMPGGKKDENGNVVARKRSKYSNYEPIWYAKHYSQLLKEGLITEEQAKQFKERAIKDTHKIDI